jgi:hypothetical protein
MQLTEIQDLAIQARMALIVGAKTFDRLFAGIRFNELDCPCSKEEQTAAEIEDDFPLHIATVAAAILNRTVEVVVVMPKVLNCLRSRASPHANSRMRALAVHPIQRLHHRQAARPVDEMKFVPDKPLAVERRPKSDRIKLPDELIDAPTEAAI